MHDGCRDEFAAFFNRKDTFALGVCNGCQMMSALKSIIPGAENWPAFRRNQVEQFEARFVMAEILDSPSIFFAGMEGSQVPIVVSHGEGRAVFDNVGDQSKVLSAVRYVDNKGEPRQLWLRLGLEQHLGELEIAGAAAPVRLARSVAAAESHPRYRRSPRRRARHPCPRCASPARPGFAPAGDWPMLRRWSAGCWCRGCCAYR